MAIAGCIDCFGLLATDGSCCANKASIGHCCGDKRDIPDAPRHCNVNYTLSSSGVRKHYDLAKRERFKIPDTSCTICTPAPTSSIANRLRRIENDSIAERLVPPKTLQPKRVQSAAVSLRALVLLKPTKARGTHSIVIRTQLRILIRSWRGFSYGCRNLRPHRDNAAVANDRLREPLQELLGGARCEPCHAVVD
eukprot:6191868-Pleurochrysis_carterae.AAC.1